MNWRSGPIAGEELSKQPVQPLLRFFSQICCPVWASKAHRWPCSPLTYATSRTPIGVLTSVSSTGAPSGASGRVTLNSGLSCPTLPGLRIVSDGLSARLSGENPNCSQSTLVAAGFTVGAVLPAKLGRLTAASAVPATAATPAVSQRRRTRPDSAFLIVASSRDGSCGRARPPRAGFRTVLSGPSGTWRRACCLANGYVTGRPPVNGFLQPMETRLSMPGDRDRRNSGMPYDPGMPAAEGRFPDRRLAHFLDEDSDQYVRRFALHLITISQPERGKVTAPLTCPTCGVPVPFTVHSPSGTRNLLR